MTNGVMHNCVDVFRKVKDFSALFIMHDVESHIELYVFSMQHQASYTTQWSFTYCTNHEHFADPMFSILIISHFLLHFLLLDSDIKFMNCGAF